MTQVSDDTGCGIGCLLLAACFPIIIVAQMIQEWHKNRADRLEEKNRLLRLETEREQLEEQLDTTRADRMRRKMEDAGYVQCARCKEWRDEVRTDGICEPCEIMEEL